MVMMMEEEELMMEEEELMMMMEEEEMQAEDEKQSSVRVTHGVTWWRGPMIGKGSFGSVYLATSNPSCPLLSPLPLYIAVKSAKISVAKSLKKEREVLSDLKGCPYVIQCYGEETTMGENGEEDYNLLLEYASGGSLHGRIKKACGSGGGLPESEVRRYTKSILSGISYVHERGYVHHDIKPANILLVSDSGDSDRFTAKICDFGLARRVKRESDKKKSSRYLRGTSMYISPDAVVEGSQDASSDIWAIGCVVFEMLTGKNVWEREKDWNTQEFVRRIGYEFEAPEIPCEVSEEGKEFLKACFVRRGEDRLRADALLNFPFVNQLHEEEEEDQEEEPMGSSCLADASSVSLVEISWFGVGGEEEDDEEEVEEVGEVEESLNTKRESSNSSMIETDSDSDSKDESCTDELEEATSVDSSVEAVDDFDYDEDAEGEELRRARFDPMEMWMSNSDDDNEDSSCYEYYPKEDEKILENHKRRSLMTRCDVGNKDTFPTVVAAF